MAASYSRKPSGLTRSISALFDTDGGLVRPSGVKTVVEEVFEDAVVDVIVDAAPGEVAEPVVAEAVAEAVVDEEVAEAVADAIVETAPEEVAEPVVTEKVTEPVAVEEVAQSVTDVISEAEAEVEGPTEPESHPALKTAIELFRRAVDALLSSDSGDREGLGLDVRAAAAPLDEAGALDALAEGVERMARDAGDPPDQATISTARFLVSPGVGSRIAARLGTERDDERRSGLTRACAHLGEGMAVALSDALAGTADRFARHAFVDAMVGMGDTAMPVIEHMVDDSRWFVVRNAVSVLGQAGGERAIELIVSTLAHADGRVRREALLALAKVGGLDAGMLAFGMLQDPDPDVRLAAAMAAGTLKVDRSLKPLLSLLEEETDHDVVVGVLGALGKLGDPGAVSAIEKRAVGSLLTRQPAHVRIAAYRALHAIRTPHAKSLLVRAADDKDAEVKAAVRELLRMR